MENITLTRAELVILLKAFGAAALLIGIIPFCILVRSAGVLSAALRSISPAILISSALLGIFVSRAWRIGWLAKWMRKPVLDGVWLGYLYSDYKKMPSDRPVRLPIVFVIRQTYLTLSIQSLTEGQTGESRVEALIRNMRTDATRLAYLFELHTTYPGRRTLTRGAGELELYSDGRVLCGAYWTDSPTHGSLQLRLQARDRRGIETFADAIRRWPAGAGWGATSIVP